MRWIVLDSKNRGGGGKGRKVFVILKYVVLLLEYDD